MSIGMVLVCCVLVLSRNSTRSCSTWFICRSQSRCPCRLGRSISSRNTWFSTGRFGGRCIRSRNSTRSCSTWFICRSQSRCPCRLCRSISSRNMWFSTGRFGRASRSLLGMPIVTRTTPMGGWSGLSRPCPHEETFECHSNVRKFVNLKEIEYCCGI
jgi:hypothetical protein